MKLIIIGHTVGVKRCIEALRSTEHSILAIFTHEHKLHLPDLALFDQRSDLFGEYAYDVFKATADFGVPVFEYQNLTDQSEIDRIQAFKPDVIVTVGCREILKPQFIASFPLCINLHPFYLPYFRGAGIDSWMILQGVEGKNQFATCHYIDKGIDSGNIICRLPYTIEQDDTPLDIFKKRIDLLGQLLINALVELKTPGFIGEAQIHSESRYFPRLNTMRDGQIDFGTWSGDEIIRFVRAFSYPYPGAWITFSGTKIHILKAVFHAQAGVHPFSHGLVFRKEPTGFWVFAKGGFIEATEVEIEGNTLSVIQLGKRVNS